MNDLKGIIEDCNKSDLVSDKVITKVIEIIGQEEWNALHDENSDICTTMGELIITLKDIPELEKELGKLEGKLADLTSEYYELENLKNNEKAELNDKLNNLASVADVRLANWQKYEKAYNETEELLDKQIEATYKLFEENKELKEKLKPENCLKLLAKDGYIKFSSDNLTKAKEEKSDIMYKCWKNTARTIKQFREN